MSNRNPPDHGAALFGGMGLSTTQVDAAWGGKGRPPSGRGPRSPGVGGLRPVNPFPRIGDIGKPKPPAKPKPAKQSKGPSGPIA